MKKIVMLAAATLMLTASLNAEPVKGAYVGLGFGTSQFSDGGYGDDVKVAYPAQSFSDNYNDSGYKLYGGYQFNKVIAVEASYTKYGTYSFDAYNGNSMVLNPVSLSIAANIGYNFGEKNEFRPFAIIGLSALNLDETGSADVYSTESGAAVRFGLGFEYAPASLSGVGFRIAYEGDYFAVDSDVNTATIKSYTQSTNLLYIGAQYKF